MKSKCIFRLNKSILLSMVIAMVMTFGAAGVQRVKGLGFLSASIPKQGEFVAQQLSGVEGFGAGTVGGTGGQIYHVTNKNPCSH